MADISSLNSSSTPLLALETFVGQFEYAKDYSSVSVTVDSDVDSTFNGVKIEWSTTGINADVEPQPFTFDAVSGLTVHVTCRAQYFRLLYENNVTDQTSFNLVTVLRREPPTATVRTIDPVNTFTPNLDVQTVQAILSGVGRFNNQQVLLPALDDVNSGEAFLFVSPRPTKADNIDRRQVSASLTAVNLANPNVDFERMTFFSATNNVDRGNMFLKLGTASGLTATNYDFKVPPGHTWQDPGKFGSVWFGDLFAIWDEVYVPAGGNAGTVLVVANFYG